MDTWKSATQRGLVSGASAASAVACFVDYRMTPDRLKSGYEQRLSRPSLALVYGAFGLGLAAGALLCRRGQAGAKRRESG
ncbi:hypothetical protein [Massilia aquatica]|uniref:Uncharacterized protein n=1 Tax=Massilia aquatica TaxID=2609000 RepID=A0ABX0MH04_9BURK|nr:hypothetical protein [Massilia aquatica]NHZ43156.1 hypothetical protein [Massilia aquatica]